jgi:hypothetical protein
MALRNVILLRHYTVSQSRIPRVESSSPWKLQVSTFTWTSFRFGWYAFLNIQLISLLSGSVVMLTSHTNIEGTDVKCQSFLLTKWLSLCTTLITFKYTSVTEEQPNPSKKYLPNGAWRLTQFCFRKPQIYVSWTCSNVGCKTPLHTATQVLEINNKNLEQFRERTQIPCHCHSHYIVKYVRQYKVSGRITRIYPATMC